MGDDFGNYLEEWIPGTMETVDNLQQQIDDVDNSLQQQIGDLQQQIGDSDMDGRTDYSNNNDPGSLYDELYEGLYSDLYETLDNNLYQPLSQQKIKETPADEAGRLAFVGPPGEGEVR